MRLAHWRADGRPKVRYPSGRSPQGGVLLPAGHGADLNAYECEFCGGWHLGASDDR